MTKKQKWCLFLVILLTIVVIKFAYFPSSFNFNSVKPTENIEEKEISEQEQEEKIKEEMDIPKTYISVYFIGQNKNKQEVYKVVKREYESEKNGTKINYAIKTLFKGPSAKEKANGIYSEIPKGTSLISIEEKPNQVNINISSDFEQGGGTDALYKRLYQLIKTANKNTVLPVYLYINGQKADVIGGEGIMLNQPLNNNSLGE